MLGGGQLVTVARRRELDSVRWWSVGHVTAGIFWQVALILCHRMLSHMGRCRAREREKERETVLERERQR